MPQPISKEWVDAYFNYGLDVNNRRIFIFDDIDQNTEKGVIQGIYLMATKSEEKPIELFVNSYGGCDYGMFGIYDALQTINCPVETVAIGKCMSAAPLLVAAGTPGLRWATQNCSFMLHDSATDAESKKIYDMRADIKHWETLNKRWATLMEKHTKKRAGYWLDICKKPYDYYFDADKAIEYGIVDGLWDEKDGEAD